MIAEEFSYVRPRQLAEAISLLQQHGDRAKILAGGHSLIPAMKLRLARPKVLVDLSGLSELSGISETGDSIRVGSMSSHADIAQSALLAERCPLMREAALHIGDRQVRNKGTIGGSLVHADPSADWPAVILALEGTVEMVGPTGPREVGARQFFVEMFQTAVAQDEIVRAVRVPATGRSVAYVKTEQKASGFALCGVAVVSDPREQTTRVGVTGVAPVPYRAAATEAALAGRPFSNDRAREAAELVGEGVEPLADIHASGEFRRHLAVVNTRRALAAATAR